MAGRPTDYNLEIATRICDLVATHTCSLRTLCATYDDLPVKSTVHLWRLKHPQFSDLYTQAKRIQADLLAEECLEISDDDSKDTKYDKDGNEVCNVEFIARSRLRIDTRKWLAAKLLPRAYGRNQDDALSTNNTLIEKLLEKL